MSDPTIFHQDVSIVANNDDPVLYGLGRLNVEYDALIGGLLTQVNSTNLTFRDNLPIANFGSTIDGRDVGLMGSRTTSDITSDVPEDTGTATGGTIATITLEAGSSAVDDFYNGWVISITGGTGSGQIKPITDYDGTTLIATVESNWATEPDSTSDYDLFYKTNTAIYYDQDVHEFILGYTPDPHTSNNINVTPGTLHVGDLIVDGTIIGGNEIVQLPDNAMTRVDILQTEERGSYFIIVESVEADGATATFAASSNEFTGVGVTDRITSSPGSLGEEINIEWAASNLIQLYHSTTRGGGTGELLNYKVKVIDADIVGGEITFAANIGTDGVGPYDSKNGNVLQFRNIAPASDKISVSFDATDKDIDIDAVESNFTLDNLGGVLSVSKGGTSLSSLTSNRFLVGDGVSAVDLTKVVPTGVVVGTTDTQTMTNKTMTDASDNLIARALWYGSGSASVSTYASGAPSIGDVLVATSATTATWQASSSNDYGSEFEYTESLTSLSTTVPISISAGSVSGGSTKLSWVTGVKSIGTFKIDWSYDWTNNSNSRDIIVVITADGSTTSDIYNQFRSGVTSNAGGFDTADFAISSSGTDQRHNNCGFFYITFGSAVTHTFEVLVGRGTTGGGSDAVTMSDLRLQIIRVV